MQILSNQILFKAISGSHLYGLNEEGSDIDYEGVYMPSPSALLGIRALENAKHSKGTDVDVTMYSLQQYGKLLTTSNFKALETLFATEDKIIQCTPEFRAAFIDHKKLFISNDILQPLHGFAVSNFSRIDKCPSDTTSRRILFDKLGYDSKYLMHCVRILKTGVHLITTGEFKVDWSNEREYFLDIKHGRISKQKALQEAEACKSLILTIMQHGKKENYNTYNYVNEQVICMSKNWLLNLKQAMTDFMPLNSEQ